MLKIDNLHAYYAQSHILHGVNLEVKPGEIVSLLGRNGAGRSTTAKAIMGLVHAQGSISWHGEPLLGKETFELAHLGLGYVPESRDIFPTLTVEQNLYLGQKHARHPGRWTLPIMYGLFTALQARRHTPAGVLSGGEQQMLTLCRTLMGDPTLLIIDEPTEGLAPQVVAQVAQVLQTVRQQGVAVLLIEQKLTIALDISDRCLVMGHGRVVFSGTAHELQQQRNIQKEWLEV